MAEKKQVPLEKNFEKLEELIEVLADADVSLEDAFRAYGEGIAILKECNEQIDRVEKQVLVLSGDGELEELEELGEQNPED